ncbi:hypothetical protein [Natrinema ejinorense]|nr:hypothetical protein [Natrinema ejinorense]
MADEASEATGSHPEQEYPAREGTDPEPTSEKAPERVSEGAVAPAGSSAEEPESANEDGEFGSEDVDGENEGEQEPSDNVTDNGSRDDDR